VDLSPDSLYVTGESEARTQAGGESADVPPRHDAVRYAMRSEQSRQAVKVWKEKT